MAENMNIPTGTVRPCLDDRAVVYDLLRAHTMAVSQRLAEARHKNVQRAEVVAADQRAAAFLASTLNGMNPAYEAAKTRTPESIEAHLRGHLADALKLYEVKPEEVADRAVFFQFAMYVLTNQIHELINDLSSHPETIEKEGPVKLERLLTKWVNYMSED
jgi:hypothetical protein